MQIRILHEFFDLSADAKIFLHKPANECQRITERERVRERKTKILVKISNIFSAFNRFAFLHFALKKRVKGGKSHDIFITTTTTAATKSTLI